MFLLKARRSNTHSTTTGQGPTHTLSHGLTRRPSKGLAASLPSVEREPCGYGDTAEWLMGLIAVFGMSLFAGENLSNLGSLLL